MIKFEQINESLPYQKFIKAYNEALDKNQKSIEAVAISSFDINSNEVESRFVNLKYINNDEWIFFTNYGSLKADNFTNHDQISALFYWSSINIQIRIKAIIYKTDDYISDTHFKNRSMEKNALAISSDQSKLTESYENVIAKYNKVYNSGDTNLNRPNYWGGFSFKPYYFEFWEGRESRLNKRDIYDMQKGLWEHSILEP